LATARARSFRAKPLVAASIGPYGAHLHDGSEYRGDYGVGRTELLAFQRERMAVLAEAGADLLACETIPSRLEAEVLLELLEEFPDVRAWLSFSCRDGTHISDGASFADCAQLVLRPDRMAGALAAIESVERMPDWLQVVNRWNPISYVIEAQRALMSTGFDAALIGKALIAADEFVGKLRMMRNAADDLGHKDFVIIARTDGVSATEAPESKRGKQSQSTHPSRLTSAPVCVSLKNA